jgi:hypothetical protein
LDAGFVLSIFVGCFLPFGLGDRKGEIFGDDLTCIYVDDGVFSLMADGVELNLLMCMMK